MTDPVEALRAVLRGIISSSSGPAAPAFDEFDAAVESARGRWYSVDAAPIDAARRLLETLDAAPGLSPEQEMILAALRLAWAASPELRLLQLLKNAIDQPEKARLDATRVFYYPDEDLLARLEAWPAWLESL